MGSRFEINMGPLFEIMLHSEDTGGAFGFRITALPDPDEFAR